MEYIVVEENTSFELSAKITELMGDGWKPQGGVSAYGSTEDCRDYYCQAMIRKHKGD